MSVLLFSYVPEQWCHRKVPVHMSDLLPARLHQKDSTGHRYLSVFYWKYQKASSWDIQSADEGFLFPDGLLPMFFCKDWINSVCVEMVLFSWLIMSLYARIFESFELPAICFLLLFHCSYYTTKSNEKETETPAFTRDFRHDTGWDPLRFCWFA